MRASSSGSRIGLPTVALNCEFLRPSHMGERVQLGLAVHRLGRSSITLDLVCHHDGQERVRMRQVLVTTALDEGHATPIPDSIRAAIARFGHRGRQRCRATTSRRARMQSPCNPPPGRAPRATATA